MAHIYKPGEFLVGRHYSWYIVVQKEGPNEDPHARSYEGKYHTFDDAIRMQYMLNGWGFPNFTIPWFADDRYYGYIAEDILSRHIFNRAYSYEAQRKYCEPAAKAEVEIFKCMLSRIKDEAYRESLKSKWISKYQEKMAQEPYLYE